MNCSHDAFFSPPRDRTRGLTIYNNRRERQKNKRKTTKAKRWSAVFLSLLSDTQHRENVKEKKNISFKDHTSSRHGY